MAALVPGLEVGIEFAKLRLRNALLGQIFGADQNGCQDGLIERL